MTLIYGLRFVMISAAVYIIYVLPLLYIFLSFIVMHELILLPRQITYESCGHFKATSFDIFIVSVIGSHSPADCITGNVFALS